MNSPLENNQQPVVESHATVETAPYEAPRIESILSSEEIEREVHYAGAAGSIPAIA